jgi:hypothetical protein
LCAVFHQILLRFPKFTKLFFIARGFRSKILFYEIPC